jgi:hypothetical protein
MRPEHDYQVAVLPLKIRWNLPREMAGIAPGITVHMLNNSAVERLYLKLCPILAEERGDPFNFETYFLFDPNPLQESALTFGDPFSVVDRFFNVMVICSSSPLSYNRVIWSNDEFRTSEGTWMLHPEGTQTSFLGRASNSFKIDEINVVKIRSRWETAQSVWDSGRSPGRLRNALTYFYYAWQSPYLDQTCINLAVVLESLFAPHQSGEITHQHCFNIAHFLESQPEQRKQAYAFFKSFYALRSTVLHGGVADQDHLCDVVGPAFARIAAILDRILGEAALTNAFNEESKRKSLIEGFLFG